MDGGGTGDLEFTQLGVSESMAVNMIQAMKKGGWKLAFENFDSDLTAHSIRRGDQGGGEVFTQANLGIFLDHGDYGTDPDDTTGANGSKQTYFVSPYPGSGNDPWIRMCQFGFGGNLRWMAILACNSLYGPSFTSMKSLRALPLKETHLVCGCGTIAGVNDVIAQYWAQNMLKKQETVADAWFDAGKQAYKGDPSDQFPGTVTFTVAGYVECMTDSLQTYTNPTNPSDRPTGLTSRNVDVWP